MHIDWSPILNEVLPPLTLALAGLVATALGAATHALMKRTKSARGQALLDRLDDAAQAAVRQVAQTEVDALKAGRGPDGKLTPDEAIAASKRALSIVKANVGQKGIAEMKKVISPDDIEAMITTHIEAAVHAVNAAPSPGPEAVAVVTSAPVAAKE